VPQLLQAGADPWLALPRKDRAFSNAVDVAEKLLQHRFATSYPNREEAVDAWEAFLAHAETLPAQSPDTGPTSFHPEDLTFDRAQALESLEEIKAKLQPRSDQA